MPNTTQIYPLSGETVFADTTGVTYTAIKNGIVYLTGLFIDPSSVSLSDILTVTKNSRTISFYKGMYTDTPSSFVLTNLLSPRIIVAGSSGSNMSDSTPATATDRNKGAYLPVKAGDQFTFNGSNQSGTIIASFYYFD